MSNSHTHLCPLLQSRLLDVREPGPGLTPHGVSVEDDQLGLKPPGPGPGAHQSDLYVPDAAKAIQALDIMFNAAPETLDGRVGRVPTEVLVAKVVLRFFLQIAFIKWNFVDRFLF